MERIFSFIIGDRGFYIGDMVDWLITGRNSLAVIYDGWITTPIAIKSKGTTFIWLDENGVRASWRNDLPGHMWFFGYTNTFEGQESLMRHGKVLPIMEKGIDVTVSDRIQGEDINAPVSRKLRVSGGIPRRLLPPVLAYRGYPVAVMNGERMKIVDNAICPAVSVDVPSWTFEYRTTRASAVVGPFIKLYKTGLRGKTRAILYSIAYDWKGNVIDRATGMTPYGLFMQKGEGQTVIYSFDGREITLNIDPETMKINGWSFPYINDEFILLDENETIRTKGGILVTVYVLMEEPLRASIVAFRV